MRPVAIRALPRLIVPGTLRGRLMLVGLIGLAVPLLVGGVALYTLTSASAVRGQDLAARTAATTVAQLAAAGRLPPSVPAPGVQLVQVVDPDGRVVAASAGGDRLTSLLDATERATVGGGGAVIVPGSRVALGGMLRAVGVRVAADGGRPDLLVVAALPTAEVDAGRRALGRYLLVLLPLVLLAASVVAWRLIGAALRPVEDLRRGAERIGAAAARDPGQAERLPVPGTRDEVAALAVTLNHMLDRLDGARAAQRAFVADAAHELRSPLATLRTQVEVADHVSETAVLPGQLLPELERLSALVEDLLTLARADDSPARGARPVDLDDLLDGVLTRYEGARVPVRRAAAGPTATVVASPDDLVRAVTNLIDNAVRHAGSAVDVQVDAPPGGGVALHVDDDGTGVAAADRERVFERFARLDEARARDSGGTGLGLAIARALIRRNRGEVVLGDPPSGQGLRATITLPAGTAGTAAGHGSR